MSNFKEYHNYHSCLNYYHEIINNNNIIMIDHELNNTIIDVNGVLCVNILEQNMPEFYK